MTVEKAIDLLCDKCAERYDDPQHTVAMVRRQAKIDGWAYRKGKDICYNCLHHDEQD